MLRLTLDNLFAHRRRLISTFLAVVLGIAFLSGTLVLGDTIKGAFNHLMATVNSGTDAYVRRVAISSGGDEGRPFGQGQRGELDDSLVEVVRRVPGVAAAVGDVGAGDVRILDRQGQVVGGGFAGGGRGGSWNPDQRLNPWRIAAGHPPKSDSDIVIDRATSKKEGLGAGD